MTTSQSLPADLPDSRPLQLAVAGYLSRYKGLSRTHAESDLRAYLSWCTARRLDPLSASRPQIELYVRWMQEVRRLKPSTVSGGPPSSPASTAPSSSTACSTTPQPSTSAGPGTGRVTLGLTHLQLEALLTAARQSSNQYDFALVCLLGLLGLRIFEATGTNPAQAVGLDLGLRDPLRLHQFLLDRLLRCRYGKK